MADVKPARFVKVSTVAVDVDPEDEAAWDALECGSVREGLLPLGLNRVAGTGVKEEVFLELTDGTRLPVRVAR